MLKFIFKWPACTLLAKTFGAYYSKVYIFFVLWMSGNGMSLAMFKCLLSGFAVTLCDLRGRIWVGVACSPIKATPAVNGYPPGKSPWMFATPSKNTLLRMNEWLIFRSRRENCSLTFCRGCTSGDRSITFNFFAPFPLIPLLPPPPPPPPPPDIHILRVDISELNVWFSLHYPPLNKTRNRT